VARVLRPGGRFVLADFSLPYSLGKIFQHGRQLSPAAGV
jgi:ubiquinone/menaquinone biosynthesis C-methylase UbiE